jgi:hypothetical protein
MSDSDTSTIPDESLCKLSSTKQCTSCNVDKDINDYYLVKKDSTKRTADCKTCRNKKRVLNRKENYNYKNKPTGLDKLIESKVITKEQKNEIIDLLKDPMVKVSLIAKKYNVEYAILQYYKKNKLDFDKRNVLNN